MMNNAKKYSVCVITAMAIIFSACTDKREPQVITEESMSGNNADEMTYEGMLSEPAVCGQKNAYDTLNVATYITKVDDTYFIADCYHDQLIYHDNITDPLDQWDVMTNEVHYAHIECSNLYYQG